MEPLPIVSTCERRNGPQYDGEAEYGSTSNEQGQIQRPGLIPGHALEYYVREVNDDFQSACSVPSKSDAILAFGVAVLQRRDLAQRAVFTGQVLSDE